MSHSDTRGTVRELRLALARKQADPNAERDRREWGTRLLRWPKHYSRRAARRRRYASRKEIEKELHERLQPIVPGGVSVIRSVRTRDIMAEAVTWTGSNPEEVSTVAGRQFHGFWREYAVVLANDGATCIYVRPGWLVIRSADGLLYVSTEDFAPDGTHSLWELHEH